MTIMGSVAFPCMVFPTTAEHTCPTSTQQLKPIEFASNLSLEMRRQGTCIARLQLIEPLASIPPQRLVTGYSLGEQQSLDPIDVLDPLVCQRLAFTAKSAAVFLLGVGVLTMAQTRGSPRL